MRSKAYIGIIIILIVILGSIVLIHQHQTDQRARSVVMGTEERQAAHDPDTALDPGLVPGNPSPLPRMVDLGADNCVPCKMMAPILQELSVEYAHLFSTHFIDVWKNPSAGRLFGARLIPTQVFYNADGKELFRNEGFMSKQDILRQWQRLGLNVSAVQS